MKAAKIALAAAVAMVAVALVGAPRIKAFLVGDKGPAVVSEASPLDIYPGFGSSDAAVLRDEIVSVWEAHRRERIVQQCMNSAGFEYFVDVPFPEGGLLKIAYSLGVEVEPSNSKDPTVLNGEYMVSLTRERRNDYLLVLQNYTLEEAEELDRSGVGKSTEDVGCHAEALREVGRFQDLKRALDPMSLHQEAAGKIGEIYRACTKEFDIDADSPGDLETRMMDGGLSRDEELRYSNAFEECATVWDNARYEALIALQKEFAIKHFAVLEAHRLKFADVLHKIKADQGFLEFLSKEAGRVRHLLESCMEPHLFEITDCPV